MDGLRRFIERFNAQPRNERDNGDGRGGGRVSAEVNADLRFRAGSNETELCAFFFIFLLEMAVIRLSIFANNIGNEMQTSGNCKRDL